MTTWSTGLTMIKGYVSPNGRVVREFTSPSKNVTEIVTDIGDMMGFRRIEKDIFDVPEKVIDTKYNKKNEILSHDVFTPHESRGTWEETDGRKTWEPNMNFDKLADMSKL